MKLTKQNWITIVKMVVKVVMVVLTARDTYSLVQDVVVVTLIDGAFFSFVVLLEFSGSSALALAMRPMAAVGAWVMYAGILLVGVLAHDTQSFNVLVVYMLARVAGGIVLTYDTWEYVQQRVLAMRTQNKQAVRAGVTDAVRRKHARERAAHNAYMLALVFLRATVLPVVGVCVSMADIFRGLRAGTLLADDPEPEPESVRVNMPARTASVHVGTQASADYHSVGDQYYWVCKMCGQDSRQSLRSKGLYPKIMNAQKGFAAHSQMHVDEQMSPMAMAAELIERLD